jgi:hypothetical protein
MPKDDNIGIKIELIKDNQSGKLKMVAHFNLNSSNIIIENNEYIWIPTSEERELIDEAFNFIPSETTNKKYSDPSSYAEKPKDTPTFEEESAVLESDIDTTKETKDEVIDVPPIEKEEPSVFEVTEENSYQNNETIEKEIDEDLEKKQNEPAMNAKVEIKKVEKEYTAEKTDEEKSEEGTIVEADSDAIEAALQRHMSKEDKDDSFKEVDEQTIIDRVLNQKKKGKWAKK